MASSSSVACVGSPASLGCVKEARVSELEVTIRSATCDDAEATASLGRRTFVETFVEDFRIPYPEADLAAHLASSYDVERHRARLGDPREAWWVAEREPRAIVGFAVAGPCGLPHPEIGPHDLELARLYVGREAQGRGVGPALLERALRWMEARGARTQWVGVWSENERAQRLYRRHGFEKAGEYDYPVGRWLDREHIMRRRLP